MDCFNFIYTPKRDIGTIYSYEYLSHHGIQRKPVSLYLNAPSKAVKVDMARACPLNFLRGHALHGFWQPGYLSG